MTDESREGARHELSPRRRGVALALLAPVFLVLVPAVLVHLGARMDEWLQWPSILPPPAHLVAGWLLVLAGWAFAMWSIYRQFTEGRGTPVPPMPTQQLVVAPPYAYCRNPMALGAFGMYLGVAILVRSPGAVLLVLVAAGALLTYIKRSEEMELVRRFGQEYLDYRRGTPFLIPRVRSRSVRRR